MSKVDIVGIRKRIDKIRELTHRPQLDYKTHTDRIDIETVSIDQVTTFGRNKMQPYVGDQGYNLVTRNGTRSVPSYIRE
jgi:hypothetical protein